MLIGRVQSMPPILAIPPGTSILALAIRTTTIKFNEWYSWAVRTGDVAVPEPASLFLLSEKWSLSFPVVIKTR